ncbi:hypothetical protein DFA_00601 [Cavenderia fasciculata]|uniref:Uncharacterized protein n=1 Tax=Cavenderia fasciculata TaxID=261658 RepID=F4PSP6_CACFS|nr:uncharacterized protein DFA_00601 [Cavenderia fasciculata]EGG20738.1 hypothetical protein DFA_00601 [Cavenderia fasciculata]|eukprot:XP_004358588.1 hypothetical protein DFA_00601 [Cavenderia fasciculata]
MKLKHAQTNNLSLIYFEYEFGQPGKSSAFPQQGSHIAKYKDFINKDNSHNQNLPQITYSGDHYLSSVNGVSKPLLCGFATCTNHAVHGAHIAFPERTNGTNMIYGVVPSCSGHNVKSSDESRKLKSNYKIMVVNPSEDAQLSTKGNPYYEESKDIFFDNQMKKPAK